MNHILGKPWAGACFQVQVNNPNGSQTVYKSQHKIHTAIWENIHRLRFYLAETAPICNGPLRGTFGYNLVCPTTSAILSGTYVFPDDFDEATKEILTECAKIRMIVPKDSVQTHISSRKWEDHWKKANEETSSSISGRHFGHYKAGLLSEHVTYLHALQATLVVKKGSYWKDGQMGCP
jgi:hypothetical protein